MPVEEFQRLADLALAGKKNQDIALACAFEFIYGFQNSLLLVALARVVIVGG